MLSFSIVPRWVVAFNAPPGAPLGGGMSLRIDHQAGIVMSNFSDQRIQPSGDTRTCWGLKAIGLFCR